MIAGGHPLPVIDKVPSHLYQLLNLGFVPWRLNKDDLLVKSIKHTFESFSKFEEVCIWVLDLEVKLNGLQKNPFMCKQFLLGGRGKDH